MSRKAIRVLLILFAIVVIVVLANITMRNLGIATIEIKIDYKGGDTLISNGDVLKTVERKFGKLSSKKRKEIHCEEIETYLLQQNLISTANVFLTLGGTLNMDVSQNRMLVRVYNTSGGQFYLDCDEQVCSASFRGAANVIIASGELVGLPKPKSLLDTISFRRYHEIYKIARFIEQDNVLRNQIDQIYFSKKDKFQLIPKVGDYVILLGEADMLEERLRKLHYLYKEGFTKYGWNNYSLVNLRFDNQVVCTRK